MVACFGSATLLERGALKRATAFACGQERLCDTQLIADSRKDPVTPDGSTALDVPAWTRRQVTSISPSRARAFQFYVMLQDDE